MAPFFIVKARKCHRDDFYNKIVYDGLSKIRQNLFYELRSHSAQH